MLFIHNNIILDTDNEIIQYNNVSEDWKDRLHIHIVQQSTQGDDGCRDCMLLRELEDSVADLGISTSSSYLSCPLVEVLEGPISVNKTIAIVIPGSHNLTCRDSYLPNNHVHVRWLLNNLIDNPNPNMFLNWNEEDLVFHFASGFALYPDKLPSSNILQVMTIPKEVYQYDLSNRTQGKGTAWVHQKGNQ